MSLENMFAFIAKVQSDTGLLEQMKAVTDADGAIAIAKSAGFEITAGDLIRQQAKITSELSDDELEKVSGGTALAVLKVANIAQYVCGVVLVGGIVGTTVVKAVSGLIDE